MNQQSEMEAVPQIICHLLALSKLLDAQSWLPFDLALTSQIEKFCKLFKAKDSTTTVERWKQTKRRIDKDSRLTIEEIDAVFDQSIPDIVADSNKRLKEYLESQGNLFSENHSIERLEMAQGLADVFPAAWQMNWYQQNAITQIRDDGNPSFADEPVWIDKAGRTKKALYRKAYKSRIGSVFPFPVSLRSNERRINYVRELNRSLPKDVTWKFSKRDDVIEKVPR